MSKTSDRKCDSGRQAAASPDKNRKRNSYGDYEPLLSDSGFFAGILMSLFIILKEEQTINLKIIREFVSEILVDRLLFVLFVLALYVFEHGLDFPIVSVISECLFGK